MCYILCIYTRRKSYISHQLDMSEKKMEDDDPDDPFKKKPEPRVYEEDTIWTAPKILPPRHLQKRPEIWYCGLGSMMNQTALALRQVYPSQSLACRIDGCRRRFTSVGGPATLRRDPSTFAYVVAHLITPDELEALEGREPPSSYVDGVIDTTLDSEWNGKTIRAAVSVSFENALTIHGGMPTARYHAMMIDGANMAGMPAIGMRQIRGYPCLRRVRKEEFNKMKIVQNSPLKYYRRDEIAGKSHHVIVNDKVFRLNKSLIPDDSTDFYRMIATRDYLGQDYSYYCVTQFYNPYYGIQGIFDRRGEYWDWMEHFLTRFMLSCYEQVGWLTNEDNMEDSEFLKRIDELVPREKRMWPILWGNIRELPPREMQNTKDEVWYVGIGSMMNLTALALRQIYPSKTLACRLPGVRREFYGFSGMATLVYDSNSETHAIAHRLTPDELAVLERREPMSSYIDCIIDSTIENEFNGIKFRVAVSVDFGENSSPWNNVGKILPAARYKQMMLEGAIESGMKRAGIEQIQSYPCTPRLTVDEFRKVRIKEGFTAATLPIYSRADVGEDKFTCIFNNKIIKMNPNIEVENSEMELFARRRQYEGKDITGTSVTGFYNVFYGIDGIKDPDSEYYKWAEHLMCGFSFLSHEQIGWLKKDEIKDNCVLEKVNELMKYRPYPQKEKMPLIYGQAKL